MSILGSHIQFSTLADFAEGRLAADERAPIEQHLAACSRCSTDVQWLQQTATLMRTDDSEDAPVHVIARAVRLLRPQPAAPSPVRRILAALQWDSASLQPSFGVRSGQAAERQLLLSAEDYDIDLRVTPQGSTWVVAGQVLGPVGMGQVELRSAAGVVEADLNQQAEFALPAVPADSYTFTLRLPDAEIALDNLQLGA